MTNLKEFENEVDNYFGECQRLRRERELYEIELEEE
jgi:hypothetical protein